MRPKIGLALGSGGARGWTQIGILEALASYGIVPDIVCGTSIGALVGAAFVTGNLEALKTRMESFGRRDVAALFDVRLTSGGLIEGRRIEGFLEELGISGAIETLPTRYGAVATEVRSGREIWFQTGPIVRAVRASISIPGVLSPMKHEDGWLVDGGVVNPVPVSLARALGADIVIAVRVNSYPIEPSALRGEASEGVPPPTAVPRVPQWLSDAVNPLLERVIHAAPDSPSYFEVLSNSLDILEDRVTRMRLAGDPPDVLLRPPLGELTWLDFHRAKELIAKGRDCAEQARTMIEGMCKTRSKT